MHIASIGIDLGKNTFHLVALGERSKVLVRKSSEPHKQAMPLLMQLETILRKM